MTRPLEPARIDWSDAAAPRAIHFGDVYHARGGPFAQARHVFLAGNGLPHRWAGRHHFVVLETGFGLGHNFLATWAAWRDDAARCEHLWFLSVDKHPPRLEDLRRAHADSPEPTLAGDLAAEWPPLTPDLHRRDFAHGRVHLLLAFGDVAVWLPQWLAQVDAFYLDGFAPDRNPAMWEARVLQRLGRLAAPGATVATWSTARIVRDALAGADFETQRRPGFDTKREMLVGRHAPRHVAPLPAGRRYGGSPGPVVIVGAGLAGAALAHALATLGVPSQVIDARDAPAQGGSGQPAGLLHGVVHADDSPHTRWFRAAALRSQAVLLAPLAGGTVRGRLHGVLRLERTLDHAAMQRTIDAQGLPQDYVQALSNTEAGERAGCTVNGAAWCYAGGGWIDPRSLVRHWLDHPLITPRLAASRGAMAPGICSTPAAASSLRRRHSRWPMPMAWRRCCRRVIGRCCAAAAR
jgi:tRNA 5-methylaminomethyl-2-thiouridine biosynthesis bifunctional protein